MIIHAIQTSLSNSMVPLIARYETSQEAMSTLTNVFSSKTLSRIMALKKKFSHTTPENRKVDEYLHVMKAIVDELALAQRPITNEDLVIIILKGLNPEFGLIVTDLKALETAIAYDELFDKLTGHETTLWQQDATAFSFQTSNFASRGRSNDNQGRYNNYQQQQRSNRGNIRGSNNYYSSNNSNRNNNYIGRDVNSSQPVCQLCDKIGHVAKDFGATSITKTIPLPILLNWRKIQMVMDKDGLSIVAQPHMLQVTSVIFPNTRTIEVQKDWL